MAESGCSHLNMEAATNSFCNVFPFKYVVQIMWSCCDSLKRYRGLLMMTSYAQSLILYNEAGK